MQAAYSGAEVQTANPTMTAFVESYEAVVDVVLTVEDEASARAIKEKMQPLVAEFEKQSKALEALPENERHAGATLEAFGRVSDATMKMASHVSALPPNVKQMLNTELESMRLPE